MYVYIRHTRISSSSSSLSSFTHSIVYISMPPLLLPLLLLLPPLPLVLLVVVCVPVGVVVLLLLLLVAVVIVVVLEFRLNLPYMSLRIADTEPISYLYTCTHVMYIRIMHYIRA